jgi:acyl carrier protein
VTTQDPTLDFIVGEFLAGTKPEEVSEDQPLISSGIIDSVGTMKLVLFLERSFGIDIEAQDIAAGRLNTLRAIADLVADKRAARDRATA